MAAPFARGPREAAEPPRERPDPTTGGVRESTPLAHEDVLVELARAAARAPVHVAREALPQSQPGLAQDVRVERLRVVDDDYDRSGRGKLVASVGEDVDHGVDVVAERAAGAAAGG